LRRKVVLGAGLFLEKMYILGKTQFWKGRHNFGVHARDGKKLSCKKIRKKNMQEERQRYV